MDEPTPTRSATISIPEAESLLGVKRFHNPCDDRRRPTPLRPRGGEAFQDPPRIPRSAPALTPEPTRFPTTLSTRKLSGENEVIYAEDAPQDTAYRDAILKMCCAEWSAGDLGKSDDDVVTAWLSANHECDRWGLTDTTITELVEDVLEDGALERRAAQLLQ